MSWRPKLNSSTLNSFLFVSTHFISSWRSYLRYYWYWKWSEIESTHIFISSHKNPAAKSWSEKTLLISCPVFMRSHSSYILLGLVQQAATDESMFFVVLWNYFHYRNYHLPVRRLCSTSLLVAYRGGERTWYFNQHHPSLSWRCILQAFKWRNVHAIKYLQRKSFHKKRKLVSFNFDSSFVIICRRRNLSVFCHANLPSLFTVDFMLLEWEAPLLF